MTQADLLILVELLNRTPLTLGERAYVQALITKLQAEIAQQAAPDA